ncbi:MAG: redoxin domain-containing protein [Candidatus Omnitrophica bacterium]|nr:redoxin domain-containing protein [Candidatus Omnitrophota bacterium]
MKEISRSFLIILILSGLCLLISQNACPALALDKDKIIEQISAGYEKMNTFSASFIQESNFQSKKTQGKGMISYERPYGLRVEVVVDAADNGLKNLSLFDGQIFWQEQRKTTGEVLRVIKSVLDLSEAYSQQIIRQFDIGFQFEGIKKQYEAVSVAKEKEGKTNVYVLTMRLKPEENEKMQKMFKSFGVEDVLQILPQQTIYYWDIDKKFCKKVKILNAKEEVISSVIYDDIKVNEELDKKLFSYSPPEGVEVFDATEILKREFKEKELDGAENKMAGQDAPAFKLTDLKGTEYDYEKIKGKILVIDFWAHWCPPCQKMWMC